MRRVPEPVTAGIPNPMLHPGVAELLEDGGDAVDAPAVGGPADTGHHLVRGDRTRLSASQLPMTSSATSSTARNCSVSSAWAAFRLSGR